MDNQELLRILRADMSAAERRTDQRFEEVKQEIAATEKRVMAYVDQRILAVDQRIDEGAKAVNQRIDAVNQRIDDLRDYIEANRPLQEQTGAPSSSPPSPPPPVVGTFVLQLMEAIR